MRKIFPILLLGGLVGVVVFWPKICPSLSQMLKVDACNPASALKDVSDQILAAAQGGLSSISSETDVGKAITDAETAQGHPFQITKPALAPKDPSVKLAGSGPLTYVQNQGLVPAKKGVTSSVVTGTTSSCQQGSHDDGKGGCVLDSHFAYSYLAQLSNRRLSYN